MKKRIIVGISIAILLCSVVFVWQFKEKVHLLKESLSKKMSSFKY